MSQPRKPSIGARRLFSNYVAPYGDMRLPGLSGLRWLSAMGYVYDGTVQAEFGGGRGLDCSGALASVANDSWLPRLLPGNELLSSPFVRSQIAASAKEGCVTDASLIPEFFGAARPFGETVGILLAYLAAAHALTFAALTALTARRERR